MSISETIRNGATGFKLYHEDRTYIHARKTHTQKEEKEEEQGGSSAPIYSRGDCACAALVAQ